MPTLHLLCGKIASGKSTLAKTLVAEHAAILLSEDTWLSRLYPGEILSIADYLRCAQRIRGVVGPLVVSLLESGVNVVLDFPANTLANREWLLGLAQAAEVPHRLHYLELDDATCRARLRARNARGDHDFAATDAEFDLITRHFCVPSEAEGLVIEVHRA
ncbi:MULTISPECIES: ATP-binding protein [unclassified Pseudomonas]|uniref:AAA family ATPase n=1 Tax=unclassified Pseudomonas TaxID=196821 RepID=UPI001038C457|nr:MULTISPECIES: ATP-binding protein [unclassified Pseudomonas]MBB6287126.1 putative kinase [Pseudomonas sp. SJZ073]MBB6310947.1 putative kinase [Pseudomonas sp. JAI120]